MSRWRFRPWTIMADEILNAILEVGGEHDNPTLLLDPAPLQKERQRQRQNLPTTWQRQISLSTQQAIAPNQIIQGSVLDGEVIDARYRYKWYKLLSNQIHILKIQKRFLFSYFLLVCSLFLWFGLVWTTAVHVQPCSTTLSLNPKT